MAHANTQWKALGVEGMALTDMTLYALMKAYCDVLERRMKQGKKLPTGKAQP